MATYIELYMDQGTSFSEVIHIKDKSTEANINISGYTITSQMRRSHYAENATANIVCTISDAANGAVTLSLGASNTAAIKAGRYVFDVQAQNTTNSISRVREGIIHLTPEATK